MRIPIQQIDAFSDRPFAGNPAAVCRLDEWLDDSVLGAIAAENNLSETAFVRPRGDGSWDLRWFTPTVEVDLCGHATLAAAEALRRWGASPSVAEAGAAFHTRSGVLRVGCAEGRWTMDFPVIPVAGPLDDPALVDALGVEPVALHRVRAVHGRRYVLAELADERAVRDAAPDLSRLGRMSTNVLLTALGETAEVDVVSRFFAPASGIAEDPVTGSAHCTLGPYWQPRLGARLRCRQRSARGGQVWVETTGDRVLLSGHATLVLEGELILE